ncbi:MAG: alginate export family protein [bacterium]|nr:alginate export family protein [bacterium]
MKRFMIILIMVTMLAGTLQLLGGEDKLSYSLEIRHRYEMNGKDFDTDSDLNKYNFLRTRLGLLFKPFKDMEAFVQLQDSRIFGEETSTLADGSANNFDLHQGYFKVRNLFKLPLTVKLGRMEVVYGPQRLMGSVGWHNIGRSFDGAIFSFNLKKVTLDIFTLKEVEQLELGDTGDKNVFGLHADLKLFAKTKTQVFIIWQKMVPSEALSRYTIGIYNKGKAGAFGHELELAYQGGERAGMDVAAYMAALNVNYTFGSSAAAPKLAVGIDYLSGDDDVSEGKYKVFDTLYATNHKYYGFMDYFLNIPVHTYGAGLMDIHATISAKPGAKTFAALKFHNFSAVEDLMLNSGAMSNAFGSEIDLTFKYKYNKHLAFILGASVFKPGDIFKEAKGPDTATWFYLMTVFKL